MHAVADRVLVLQVEGYAAVVCHRGPPFGSKVWGAELVEALPEALRLEAGVVRDLRHVAVHRLPVEHDPFARDHHVAHEARAQPEDPVARDALRVERRRCVVVEDDEVGGRAGTQGPEQRLVEDRPASRAPSARRASGQAAAAPTSSSRSRKNAVRDSSNMSEPIPSVPSGSRPP